MRAPRWYAFSTLYRATWLILEAIGLICIAACGGLPRLPSAWWLGSAKPELPQCTDTFRLERPVAFLSTLVVVRRGGPIYLAQRSCAPSECVRYVPISAAEHKLVGICLSTMAQRCWFRILSKLAKSFKVYLFSNFVLGCSDLLLDLLPQRRHTAAYDFYNESNSVSDVSLVISVLFSVQSTSVTYEL